MKTYYGKFEELFEEIKKDVLDQVKEDVEDCILEPCTMIGSALNQYGGSSHDHNVMHYDKGIYRDVTFVDDKWYRAWEEYYEENGQVTYTLKYVEPYTSETKKLEEQINARINEMQEQIVQLHKEIVAAQMVIDLPIC